MQQVCGHIVYDKPNWAFISATIALSLTYMEQHYDASDVFPQNKSEHCNLTSKHTTICIVKNMTGLDFFILGVRQMPLSLARKKIKQNEQGKLLRC